MALSSINKLAIQASPGQLYIVAAPASFVGSTLTAKLKELFDLFYSDGDSRKTLIATSPWGALNADGLKGKLKQEPVKYDPIDGPPTTVSFQHLEASAEAMIHDLTAEKLQDILSGTTNAQVAIASGVGKAARKTNAHGGEAYPTVYSFLYRYPSRQFAGEYDHVLIPFGVIEVDGEYELSKKGLRAMKVKITAESSANLVNPDNGRLVYWIEDRVTGAAS